MDASNPIASRGRRNRAIDENPPTVAVWTRSPWPAICRRNRRLMIYRIASSAAVASIFVTSFSVLGVLFMMPWMFPATLTIVVVGAALTGREVRRRGLLRPKPTRDLIVLAEDLDDPGVALAEIHIWRKRRPMGVDQGLVWIADGLLHFRGTATYFALSGDDFGVAIGDPARDFVVRLDHDRTCIEFERIHVQGTATDEAFRNARDATVRLSLDRPPTTERRIFPPQSLRVAPLDHSRTP